MRWLLTLAITLPLCSCSSVGVYSVKKHASPGGRAPAAILVERFSAPASVFDLGDRPAGEQRALRAEIVNTLARSTAGQIRTHAAPSGVVGPSDPVRPGTWLVRGRMLRVDQGNLALRTAVGLGKGRTEMRTEVAVFRVSDSGLVPLFSFRTAGNSGMEPGAAFGIASGGVGTAMSAASAAGSLLLSSMPGVSSDIDRTSYEIAATVSQYLQRHGLLSSSRVPIVPNRKGELPSTINLDRAIPAPLRAPN